MKACLLYQQRCQRVIHTRCDSRCRLGQSFAQLFSTIHTVKPLARMFRIAAQIILVRTVIGVQLNDIAIGIANKHSRHALKTE